jgi:hypothetical protein
MICMPPSTAPFRTARRSTIFPVANHPQVGLVLFPTNRLLRHFKHGAPRTEGHAYADEHPGQSPLSFRDYLRGKVREPFPSHS